MADLLAKNTMPIPHVLACEVPACPLPCVPQRFWIGRRCSAAEGAHSIASAALLPSRCSHEQYNTWNFCNENHLRKFKCHSCLTPFLSARSMQSYRLSNTWM